MSENLFNAVTDASRFYKSRAKEAYSESMAGLRGKIFGKIRREYGYFPPEEVMALGFKSFLTEKEIFMFPDDILAGYAQDCIPKVSISDEAQILLSRGCAPDERSVLQQLMTGLKIGLYLGQHGGHVIGGYDRVLQKGLGVIAQEARKKAEENVEGGSGFAQSAVVVCDAAEKYILRYAEKADSLRASVKEKIYSDNLARIADACRWVAYNSPRDFMEAVQLLWFTHEIISCEQQCSSLSLGRIDSLLYPYYEKDIKQGVLTPQKAYELIEALWVKFGCLKAGFQNVTLGGIGPDGEYQANEVSYMCLKATKILKNDQPLISVRWHKNMPENFWKEIQELIETGMGFPALFNDDIVIKAKRKVGVSDSDVFNYGIVGCVEPSIPGKEFSHTEDLRVNMAKVLALMLNSGKCLMTGESMPLKTVKSLNDVKTFEEFLKLYKQELEHLIDVGIKGVNILDGYFGKLSPYPFLSATMQGCIENNKDVTCGGTVYNLSTVNACGMANAGDSLNAIDKLVFREKKFTFDKLVKMISNDFKGSEYIRSGLISSDSRYGNDCDDVDFLMKDIVETFCNEVGRHRSPRGGQYQTGMYTVDHQAKMGALTETLPDGRLAGISLANGFSPSQGADKIGPTAVIKSITKIDHSRFANCMVLDLKFIPSFFSKEENRYKFKMLIETYFKLGGMEVQFNIVNKDTLVKAQEHPEDYEDLLVRVSGFSAYFIDLDKILQNEIIARTEYSNI